MATTVTVRLEPMESSTLLYLEHAGFPNEKLRDETSQAWPVVLAQQERVLSATDTA